MTNHFFLSSLYYYFLNLMQPLKFALVDYVIILYGYATALLGIGQPEVRFKLLRVGQGPPARVLLEQWVAADLASTGTNNLFPSKLFAGKCHLFYL